jgi:hypothetical protein
MLRLWDPKEQPRCKRQLATSTFQWTCHDFLGSHPRSAAPRSKQAALGEGLQALHLPSLQKEPHAQESAALQRVPPRFLPELSGCLPLLYPGWLPHRPAPPTSASVPGYRGDAPDIPSGEVAAIPFREQAALGNEAAVLWHSSRFRTGAAHIPHRAADTPPQAHATSSPSPSHFAVVPAKQSYPRR